MTEQGPPHGERRAGSGGDGAWKVDKAASLARLEALRGRSGGKLVYQDEQGRLRRLPADMSSLTPEELRAAAAALSSALGAPDPDYARLAAVERLNEMRAAGTLSEESYERERRRLTGGD